MIELVNGWNCALKMSCEMHDRFKSKAQCKMNNYILYNIIRFFMSGKLLQF